MKNLAKLLLFSFVSVFFASCEPEDISEYDSYNYINADDFEEIGEHGNQENPIDDNSRDTE